jgi:alpha-ketoglutarate-dependent taurine dioxygenase
VQITPQAGQLMGSTVTGFDIDTATPAEIDELRGAIYQHRILILKEQQPQPGAVHRARQREEILYISEAGTCELREADGTKMPDDVLKQLLEGWELLPEI